MAGLITIIGLGSGDESKMSLGVWNKLQSASRIYLRTERHPSAEWLKGQGVAFRSFDEVYEAYGNFPDVYDAIVDTLLELATESEEELVYAVPGHPAIAETTTRLLRERCPEKGIELRLIGGESFLDEVFARFGLDPIEGCLLLDGADLNRARLNPRVHTIIAQVFDSLTAADVKLTLMELYPDDYEVTVGHALGVEGAERIVRMPLYELDRVSDYGNLSLIWVPATAREDILNGTFERLHEIVRILRSPGGCPWDREQTHASIRKNLIEETYEVLETIDDDDPDAMCEEMGDLLLQIMLHSQMEEETGAFTAYDVIRVLNEKLIRRHPHVFGEASAENSEEALGNWQQIKQEEKRKKGLDPAKESVLGGIPRDLPDLMKAYRLQKKAAGVGFDWNRLDDVVAKIREELEELLAEIDRSAQDRQKDELGDLLFSIVNLARFLKINPEEALASTNRKFYKRFCYIEDQLRLKGKTFDNTPLLEMEDYWQEAKNLF